MQENLNLETLQKQFQIVKAETNTSHVMEYGDMVSSSVCWFWLQSIFHIRQVALSSREVAFHTWRFMHAIPHNAFLELATHSSRILWHRIAKKKK